MFNHSRSKHVVGGIGRARFDAKLEQRLAELRAELKQDIGVLRQELHGLRAGLIKWMFGFWVTAVLTLAGLMVALGGN